MKKKLLLAGAALLLAAAAVTGFSAYEESNIAELVDANIEAMADNESEGTMSCHGFWGWCSFDCDKCGFSISALGREVTGSHKCSGDY